MLQALFADAKRFFGFEFKKVKDLLTEGPARGNNINRHGDETNRRKAAREVDRGHKKSSLKVA